MLRGVAVAALVGLVAACGWHLRGGGQGGLAGKRLIVESEAGQGELLSGARQSLRRLDVELVDAVEKAPRLTILGENTSRSTITTDDDGRASAWELEYRLRFRLLPAAYEQDADDGPQAPLISTTSVRTAETYEASPQDTQAEQAQRRQLTRELREEAIRLMLARVASALDE